MIRGCTPAGTTSGDNVEVVTGTVVVGAIVVDGTGRSATVLVESTSVGALVDANLATTTKLPLGFALFSNFSARPDLVQVEGRSALNNGIKISYTGAPHFNLGIELSSLRVPLPNLEDKVTSTSALISCIYYFN